MKKFLLKLICSDLVSEKRFVHPAIKSQGWKVAKIWNEKEEKTFGIERLLRLLLVLSAFVFPGLYVRHVSGYGGLLCRKLATEFYVVVKLCLPLIVFSLELQSNPLILALTAYLLIETLLYLLGLIFLSDIYVSPISNKRSYLMVMINYVEICLGFAVLYEGFASIKDLAVSIDAIYFSFITATTIGYGDMLPNDPKSKILVIVQSMYTLVLIGLVLTNFTSNINYKNDTYKAKSNGRKNKHNKAFKSDS
ncbi:TPA: potassium channel family protein [Vibrio alginolyticus]